MNHLLTCVDSRRYGLAHRCCLVCVCDDAGAGNFGQGLYYFLQSKADIRGSVGDWLGRVSRIAARDFALSVVGASFAEGQLVGLDLSLRLPAWCACFVCACRGSLVCLLTDHASV